MFNIVQQFPVTLPPAVYALFDVTDNQIVRIYLRHTVVKQLPEVLPLNSTRILELINHDVLQVGSHLFKYKRCVRIFHQCAKQ